MQSGGSVIPSLQQPVTNMKLQQLANQNDSTIESFQEAISLCHMSHKGKILHIRRRTILHISATI